MRKSKSYKVYVSIRPMGNDGEWVKQTRDIEAYLDSEARLKVWQNLTFNGFEYEYINPIQQF